MGARGRRVTVAIAALLVLGGLLVAARAAVSRDGLRSLVSRRFNPVVTRLGLVGGRRSPWSYLEHVGRRSGTVYRTPVFPLVSGDHVYVPLPYGTDVQWVRNVRAAGHCRIQRHATILDLDEPALVPASGNPAIPAWYRRFLDRRGTMYLRLHVLHAESGCLGDAPGTTAEGAIPA